MVKARCKACEGGERPTARGPGGVAGGQEAGCRERCGHGPRGGHHRAHVLNWHDGEVRLLGDFQWVRFPATGGQPVVDEHGPFTVFHPHFWQYQYMKNAETRAWMFERKSKRYTYEDLRVNDVAWILEKEGNETNNLKFVPAAGGPEGVGERAPAAGGNWDPSHGTFYVKQGHFVTLAEMFRFGSHHCTCFDIYRTFVHLPIYVYKMKHSSSRSVEGLQRKAAKLLMHEETGKWALPRYPPRR